MTNHSETSLPLKAVGHLAKSLCEAMWLAIVILVPLVMSVATMRTFEAAKLVAVAPLAAMALTALVVALASGVADLTKLAFRQRGTQLFILVILSATISAVVSDSPWIATFGDYFRREGLMSWLVYASLFFSLVFLLRGEMQLERLIDAVLLASVAPCVYALQQRYGFDFFVTAGLALGKEATRPGSNLGNPIFLAAYLLLVTPLSVFRLVSAQAAWPQRWPWMLLLVMQLWVAFSTQSRGPLLGLVSSMFLLALVLSALLGKRRLLVATIGLGVITVAALLMVNLHPSVRDWALMVPMLKRFVLSSVSELSVGSRIGIWSAGMHAFLAEPLIGKIIGSGADAAHFKYFPHMPLNVLRAEGFSETIDRLHNDSLETTMTFGVLGYLAQVSLFSTLVWATANRLFGLSLPGGWLTYILVCLACASMGGTLVYALSDSIGLIPLAVGISFALCWGATLASGSWAALGQSQRTQSNQMDLLLAAVICALIGFWIEAQVGVPAIAGRTLIAVFAAIAVVLLGGILNAPAPVPVDQAITQAQSATPRAPKKKRVATKKLSIATPRYVVSAVGWMTCLALMALTMAYFPPLMGPVIYPPNPGRLNTIIIPMASVVAAGFLFCWLEAQRTQTGFLDAVTQYLIWLSAPLFLFFLGYSNLGGSIANTSDELLGRKISYLIMFSIAAWAATALLFATYGLRGQRPKYTHRLALPYMAILFLGTAAIGALVYWHALRDLRADVEMKLGTWAQNQGNLSRALPFFRRASDTLPSERRYTGSYASRLIENAVVDIRLLQQGRVELGPRIIETLKLADQLVMSGWNLAPRDPWTSFAVANVNQFLALKALEDFQNVGEREQRAERARQYFALAHNQYPVHPWILRNWAQLEFDQGNKSLAYAKFDATERIDPRYVGNYEERLKYTLVYGDHDMAVSSLRRGMSYHKPGSSEHSFLLRTLARYLRSAGKDAESLSAWHELLQADSSDFDAMREIAEIYARQGQVDLALGNAQAALLRIDSSPKHPDRDLARAKIKSLIQQLSSATRDVVRR